MPSTIRVALSEKLESEVPSWYPLNSAFHDGPFWKRIPDKLFQREYLVTISGLLRHRTLLGLPSPNSPHLLSHDWELVDYPEEEVENIIPAAKPSVARRLVAKIKSSVTPAPPLPLRIIPATRPQVLTPSRPPTLLNFNTDSIGDPWQAYSPDSATTEKTYFTTDTQETIPTPQTSLFSLDLALEPQGEWNQADVPERPAFMSPASKPILLPPQLPPRRVPSPTPVPPPLPPRKNEAAGVFSHDPVPFPTLPPLPPRRPGVPIIEVEPPEENVDSMAETSRLAKPPTRARPASVSYRQPKKSIIQEIKHYLQTKFE
ncbi:hypothetical protein FRC10_005455 [Ceratobasidium sp. 414]|nr:hypothetical protein FRC10_005455 [Ceratobasidium sp. 414]